MAALIKEVTILLSEWDIGTEEGVRLLHRTRDEQVSLSYCSCLLGFLRVNSTVRALLAISVSTQFPDTSIGAYYNCWQYNVALPHFLCRKLCVLRWL